MIVIFAIMSFATACSILSGVWQNELGSIATIKSDRTGAFTGLYSSAVGGTNGNYSISGRIDPDCSGDTFRALSFAVSWQNKITSFHSSTSWSGFLVNDTIYTTWLLVSSMPSFEDIWSATRVGTNVFRRQ